MRKAKNIVVAAGQYRRAETLVDEYLHVRRSEAHCDVWFKTAQGLRHVYRAGNEGYTRTEKAAYAVAPSHNDATTEPAAAAPDATSWDVAL